MIRLLDFVYLEWSSEQYESSSTICFTRTTSTFCGPSRCNWYYRRFDADGNWVVSLYWQLAVLSFYLNWLISPISKCLNGWIRSQKFTHKRTQTQIHYFLRTKDCELRSMLNEIEMNLCEPRLRIWIVRTILEPILKTVSETNQELTKVHIFQFAEYWRFSASIINFYSWIRLDVFWSSLAHRCFNSGSSSHGFENE